MSDATAHSGAAGSGAGPSSESPPYRWGLAAGAAVLLLYVVTLAPTTQFWDTSEYIATGHILGIPHPPGNPLFVILASARPWRSTSFPPP